MTNILKYIPTFLPIAIGAKKPWKNFRDGMYGYVKKTAPDNIRYKIYCTKDTIASTVVLKP
jgi:hypothetical protein